MPRLDSCEDSEKHVNRNIQLGFLVYAKEKQFLSNKFQLIVGVITFQHGHVLSRAVVMALFGLAINRMFTH